MEGEIGVTESIIDELHCWDITGGQMEGESGVAGSIIDELHSWDIQGDEMEGESGGTRSIIDELHSWDIEGDQLEGGSMVLLEVSSTKLILGISKAMKWKVKVVLLKVSLMNFFFGDPRRSNGS